MSFQKICWFRLKPPVLEETMVQPRLEEARQPIVRLKNEIMVSSQNPLGAWSVLEMTMISIPGDANKWSLPDAVPLKAVEHQVIWGACSSPPQTLRPHRKPEESACGGRSWASHLWKLPRWLWHTAPGYTIETVFCICKCQAWIW